MRYFLGVEVLQKEEGIYISQKKYAQDVLKMFGMASSNPVNNPIVPGVKLHKNEKGTKVDVTGFKQNIDSLMYLTATWPDLIYVVGLISRYMESPTVMHIIDAKRILRYIKGTMELGIMYKRCIDGSNGGRLLGYTDNDYAGDLYDRRSTSSYVFVFRSGAVAWSSKKHPIVTLSTTEQSMWLLHIVHVNVSVFG